MDDHNNNARNWLRNNGYDDVADMIDEIIEGWRKNKKSTRRNWWDILAGGKGGKPKTIEGKQFPVLRVAQVRQGKPISENAIARNPKEIAPKVRKTNRWIKDSGFDKNE